MNTPNTDMTSSNKAAEAVSPSRLALAVIKLAHDRWGDEMPAGVLNFATEVIEATRQYDLAQRAPQRGPTAVDEVPIEVVTSGTWSFVVGLGGFQIGPLFRDRAEADAYAQTFRAALRTAHHHRQEDASPAREDGQNADEAPDCLRCLGYGSTPSEHYTPRNMMCHQCNGTGKRHEVPMAPQTESAEAVIRDVSTAIINALSAIVNVRTPDALYDLDAIPREPVMDEVRRIKAAVDKLHAPLPKPQARDVAWKQHSMGYDTFLHTLVTDNVASALLCCGIDYLPAGVLDTIASEIVRGYHGGPTAIESMAPGAPEAQQPLDGQANNAGVATGSRNCSPRESVTLGSPAPSSAQASKGELPGMWSQSDFMGGDPDDRSSSERALASDTGRQVDVEKAIRQAAFECALYAYGYWHGDSSGSADARRYFREGYIGREGDVATYAGLIRHFVAPALTAHTSAQASDTGVNK